MKVLYRKFSAPAYIMDKPVLEYVTEDMMRDKPLFISTIIFLILYAVFMIAVFSPLNDVLFPFVTTGFLAYILTPVIKFLKSKLKLSDMAAALLVYAIIIIVGVFAALYAFPKIYNALKEITGMVEEILPGASIKLFEGILKNGEGGLYEKALAAVKTVFNFFVGGVASFYILSDGSVLGKMVDEMVPRQLLGSFRRLADDVKVCMDSFFKGQILIAIILFLADGVFLYFTKVPYGWGLSFIAAFLDMIPYVGAFVGIGLILLVAIVKEANFVIVLAGLLIIQQIENNIITPKISSSSLLIHPALTVLVLYVGSFGGFWGLLLAVPATCILKKLLERLIQAIL